MADAELRELERAFAASGAVDDEARWLQAQLRTGALARERVELAAALGHAAAASVVTVTGTPRLSVDHLLHLVRTHWPPGSGWGSIPLGWQTAVRTTIALARALPPFDDPSAGKHSIEALEAAEAWCCCPCASCSARANYASRWGSAPAYVGAASCASSPGGTDKFPGPGWVLRVEGVWRECARDLGTSRTRTAVIGELLPWALGRSDPVRARVEGRRG